MPLDAGTYYVCIGAITFEPETSGWRWNRSSAAWNFLSWIETTIFTGFFPINPGDLTFQVLGPGGADDCAEAEPLFVGATPFDTTGFSIDGPAHTPTQCSPDGQIHHDAWYRYTAGCDGLLQMSTCTDTSFDTVLAVYADGACPPPAQALLVCNDDALACGTGGSQVLLPVQAGQPYLVRVGGAGADQAGPGVLTVAQAPMTGELRLTLPTAPVGFSEGQQITVSLAMADLCDPAGGYLAHLAFDPQALALEGATYTAEPFGLHIPVASDVTGRVSLSALANPALGQSPSAADATLAEVTFTVLRPLCVPPVTLVDADPPSRLLDPQGASLRDHELVVDPPSSSLLADVNRDGRVDVDDLLEVILQWGPCPVPGASCTADLDCNGTVAVDDLITVILSWS
jgi:hypothetical protein